MDYRRFHTTGQKVSLLGFGAMRLPVQEDGKTNIDEKESIRMIRYAIDQGVSYVDTAYPYHGGESEVVVGKALKDGYREKVLLADKLPIWMVKSPEDLPRLLSTQLERLGEDHIDMYLIHSLTRDYWEKVKEYKVLEFLEDAKKQGLIRAIGFSFHDEYSLFQEILAAYPWDFCQIQFNYLDVDFQAGLQGLLDAGERNIPVVVMEPIKGGGLGNLIPEQVRKVLEEGEATALGVDPATGKSKKRQPAEWALRFVADFPQVVTILSGMSTMEQVEENLGYLSNAAPGSMTQAEKDLIQKAAAVYKDLIPAPCTQCGYCLPSCPVNIDIPTVLMLYNEWNVLDNHRSTRNKYNLWIEKGHAPADCIACGACHEACPQHLPVPELMVESAELFQ